MRSLHWSPRLMLMIVVLAGCLASPPPRDQLGTVVQAGSLEPRSHAAALWAGYTSAVRSGSADAVAGWFTPDALLLEPDVADIRGRSEIRNSLDSAFRATKVTQLTVTSQEARLDGNELVDFGTYSETVVQEGKASVRHRGRYAALWRRSSEGRWGIARIMTNHLPPK